MLIKQEVWIVLFILLAVSAGKKKEKKVKLATKSVVARGLVKESVVKPREIFKEHQSYCDSCKTEKSFSGLSLGYVTPWNGHGYDTAKWFGSKFSYVSPVWLQVKRRNNGRFAVEGAHDIDAGWVSDVKKNEGVKVVPRALFDGWSMQDYLAVFSSEAIMKDLAKRITDFLKKHKFDGVVIEVWSQLGGQKRNELAHLLMHVGETLHEANLQLVLVIPPVISQGGGPGMFGRSDFEMLVESVDAFSLMTYDYSSAGQPGPNSPIAWVEKNVRALVSQDGSPWRHKILLGLNFYGNDFHAGGGGPITGPQYVEVLDTKKPEALQWQTDSKEHLMTYSSGLGEHRVWYPTLASISARIELAKFLDTGISIWEIGQGLDYFFDLL